MAAQLAPVYPIPFSDSEHYAGIEYPGPVKNVPRALKTLGGLDHISRTLTSSPHPAVAIELNLNPTNKFHHPVPAAILESGNIVMRVVKRRRKRPKLDEHGCEVDAGIYTMEAVGVATRTVRFRGALPSAALVPPQLTQSSRCCFASALGVIRNGRLSVHTSPRERPHRLHGGCDACHGWCAPTESLRCESVLIRRCFHSGRHQGLYLPRAERRL